MKAALARCSVIHAARRLGHLERSRLRAELRALSPVRRNAGG